MFILPHIVYTLKHNRSNAICCLLLIFFIRIFKNYKWLKEFFIDYENKKDVTKYDLFFKKIAHLCFLESNPICIKYLLEEKKECTNVLRLPLTAISYESKCMIDKNFDKIIHDNQIK